MNAKKLIIPCFIITLLISFFSKQALGDTISNGNYSIDVNTIDTNPQPAQRQNILKSNFSQKSYFTTGLNYTVLPSHDSFSINLSQAVIDYGILSSTNPVTRTAQITIGNSALGAEVLTSEDYPLLSTKQNLIQNTTCDNGMCTPTAAAQWTNTLTYGFGYRCDSQEINLCDSQFSEDNSFKQYPNDAANQNLAPVITSTSKTSSSKVTITNKVNISGTQKSAAYYNSITYLAVPNF